MQSEWNINPDTRHQPVSTRRMSLREYCGKVAANSKNRDSSFEHFKFVHTFYPLHTFPIPKNFSSISASFQSRFGLLSNNNVQREIHMLRRIMQTLPDLDKININRLHSPPQTPREHPRTDIPQTIADRHSPIQARAFERFVPGPDT